jgi:hypothetical protein
MQNRVFSIELAQYMKSGGTYNRGCYDIKAPTAERAISTAKKLARTEDGFWKTKPIHVETLKMIVTDLR